jgi:lipid-A-disaccharide synthase
VRYFFSTGEPSGELSAVLLAQAISAYDRDAQFEGIGAERMRAAGFTLYRNNTGWASMGPIAAVPRIPKLLATMWRTAAHIAARKPDLVILVDFGVFNIRLARTLRKRLNYTSPVLDLYPPGAWLDRIGAARAVSAYAVPLTAFEHQYEFYKDNRLPIVYFGHPLASQYVTRPPREAPPFDGGTIAILPGSRSGELRQHFPALAGAYRLLKWQRPNLRGVFGAADARGEARLRRAIAREELADVSVVRGVPAAVADADAAWVSSGTAVLETTLLGVPTVALYILAPMLVRHARRVYPGKYITLPNLVLQREVVPEFQQEEATPEHLADAMERLLRNPAEQYDQFSELRTALGPPDALEHCAKFAVALAQAGRV